MKVVMGNLAAGNVRLCKYHREAIAKKVLNYKFQSSSNTLKSIETEHKNLAQAVYEAAFSKKERETIDSLPKGWMWEGSTIKARFGGEVSELTFSGTLSGLRGSHRYNLLHQMGYTNPEHVNKRMPYQNHYGILAVFDHDSDITARYNAMMKRFTTLMEESAKAQRVLEATLRNASTSNALIKAWPEVEPFVRQVVGTKSPAASVALVVPVADLNATFGLPVPA